MFLASLLFGSEETNFFKKIKFPGKDPDNDISPANLVKFHFNKRPNVLNNRLLENYFDYLIIGSGPSGLTCANLLAMDGKKVIVVDRHPEKLGGALHSFDRGMFTFHPISHVMTGLSPDSTFDPLKTKSDESIVEDLKTTSLTRKLVNFMTHNSLMIHPTTTEIITGNPLRKRKKKKFTFTDTSASLRTLFVRYPSEVQSLKKFFTLVETLAKKMETACIQSLTPTTPSLLSRSPSKGGHHAPKDQILDKYFETTFQDVLYEYFRHPEIRDLLHGMVIGSGQVTPYKVLHLPFALVSRILHNCLNNGLYFVAGGMDHMARGMIHTLHKFGGAAFCGVDVEKIMLADDKESGGEKIVGVMLSDESKIFCKNVISSIGIRPTLKLLPEPSVSAPTSYEKKLFGISGVKKRKKTTDYFLVYLGIEGRPEELGLREGKVTVVFPKWVRTVAKTPVVTPVVLRNQGGLNSPMMSNIPLSSKHNSATSSPSQSPMKKPAPKTQPRKAAPPNAPPSSSMSSRSTRSNRSSKTPSIASSIRTQYSTKSSVIMGPQREEAFDGPFVLYCDLGTRDEMDEDESEGELQGEDIVGTSVTLMLQIKSRLFQRFKYGKYRENKSDYAKYCRRKKQLTRIALDKFLMYFPKCKNVKVYECATSRTTNEFLGHYRFNQLEMDKDRLSFTPPFQNIKGLHVTGGDVLPMAGIHGAMLSGLVTAQNIMQKNLVKDLNEYKPEI